jgi:hypothetical protein
MQSLRRPWLKPLIGILAALAIGIGALFLGMTFAAPAQIEVASGTEVVPVVAPVAVGDAEPDADAEGRQLAEREVRLPGDAVESVDPSVRAVIDELAESPDPASEITVLDGDAEGDDSSVDDDSCAPRDGTPSGDCPDGIRSTVLPLIHLRDFLAGVEVNPPGGRFGSLLDDCDAASLNPTDGSIPMGVVATAPASYSLEFRETLDPGAVAVTVPVTTPDDQRGNWETILATATSADELPQMRFCFTVPGLAENTAYTGVLTGVSDDGRVLRPDTFHFNTAGDPVHPSLRLVPIGENLLFASALHSADETVDIRLARVEPGAAPSCDIDPSTEYGQLTSADTEVSEDELVALNLQPGSTRQHSETFTVMPGATVVVCARWFHGEGSHSWERDQAIFESSAVAQSPDRLIPTLTIVDWTDAAASPLRNVAIEVATAEGSACGGTEWTPDDPSGVSGESAVVCRPGFLGASGVRVDGDRIWDLGFSGDLVVRGRVDLDSGFSEASILLPALDGGCRGVCEAPDDSTYRIRMAGVDVDLLETWAPGGNGQGAWNLTPTVDEAPEYLIPDLPQIDASSEWRVSTPVWGQDYVDYSLPIAVDRPVDFVLRFGGSAAAAETCHYGGTIGASGTPSATLEVTGHLDAAGTLVMRGVCLGGQYEASLQLTDADGNVATWGLSDPRSWWGPNAVITAPLLPVHLNYFAGGPNAPYSRIQVFDLQVGTAYERLVNDNGGEVCTDQRFVRALGAFDTELGATSTVRLRIDTVEVDGWTAAACTRLRDDNPPRVGDGELSLIDLFRMGDATMQFGDPDPATGVADSVRLYLD